VKERLKSMIHRRDLLWGMIGGAAAAAATTAVRGPAAAELRGSDNKRKARYQANSAEVQDFYRVNRYPTR
jgi:hypothetical protein